MTDAVGPGARITCRGMTVSRSYYSRRSLFCAPARLRIKSTRLHDVLSASRIVGRQFSLVCKSVFIQWSSGHLKNTGVHASRLIIDVKNTSTLRTITGTFNTLRQRYQLVLFRFSNTLRLQISKHTAWILQTVFAMENDESMYVEKNTGMAIAIESILCTSKSYGN